MAKPSLKEKPQDKVLNYYASPTLVKFHASTAKIRAVMGPVGSGKSVGCCAEVFAMACAQEPDAEGIRKTRMIVVRNTFPELENTTIKTWKDWFPPGDPAKGCFGKMSSVSPITHWVEYAMPDGTKVECEVIFLALDKPDDVKKLMSLECTAVWFNEVRYIQKEIVDAAEGRIGRYPSIKSGVPCTRKAIIMDTNPPDDQHWFYKLAEEEKPDGWDFFFQPSGLSPEAENLENLEQPPNYRELSLEERRTHGRKYYTDMIPGKEQEYVNVHVHGQYGFVREGYPVFAKQWNTRIHVSEKPIQFNPLAPAVVGVDCTGRHPAAGLMQRGSRGHWKALYELCITDDAGMGARAFARLLKEELAALGVNFSRLEVWGDPAGAYPSTDEETFFQILHGQGIRVKAAPTNDIKPRIEVVEYYLSNLLDGEPLLQFCPEKCKHTVRGFQGGYQYKKISTAGYSRPDDKPLKNRFADIQDAWQYALLGIGGMREVKGIKRSDKKVIQINTAWSVY